MSIDSRRTKTRTKASAQDYSMVMWPGRRRQPLRVVWAEIDREAQKGKPLPSDHAPLIIDIDSPGHPFDAGWASADSRIAARRS